MKIEALLEREEQLQILILRNLVCKGEQPLSMD